MERKIRNYRRSQIVIKFYKKQSHSKIRKDNFRNSNWEFDQRYSKERSQNLSNLFNKNIFRTFSIPSHLEFYSTNLLKRLIIHRYAHLKNHFKLSDKLWIPRRTPTPQNPRTNYFQTSNLRMKKVQKQVISQKVQLSNS